MRIFLATTSCAVLLLVFHAAEARPKKPSKAETSAPASDSFWSDDLDENAASTPYAVGVISWYGRGFHGRKTASGERYNMNELTCASRELSFGTVVEVTNLQNGEKVVLRVNDRGPFHRGRILDVSRAAAQQLGFIGSGSTRAELRVYSNPGAIAQR